MRFNTTVSCVITGVIFCHSLSTQAAVNIYPNSFGASERYLDKKNQTAQIKRRMSVPDELKEERKGSPKYKGHQAPAAYDPLARPAKHDTGKYKNDPVYPDTPYDVDAELKIYGGKREVVAPRPIIELGFPQYREGIFGTGHNLVGEKNLVRPQFLLYGDWRSAVAFNDNGAKEAGQVASRLNLEADLKITATERLHAAFQPFSKGGDFSRYEFFGDDRKQGDLVLDGNIDSFFFEGDVGAIQSGLSDEYTSYDLPIAFGFMPLFYQNGIWVEDAFTGGAVSLAAQNSPTFDISNYDITAFFGVDKVSNAGLLDSDGKLADHAGNILGIVAFADMLEAHIETGLGYIDDTRDEPNGGFGHANFVFGITKRYRGTISNSTRIIWNFGQKPSNGAAQTADGVVLLFENSLVTSKPSFLVPYLNLFAGFDRPQPLARGNTGILKNTGINFETDALTGFPKLDDTARDAWGGALGISYLFDLSRQIVAEVSTVQPMSNISVASGDQYAVGLRYQQNLFGRDKWLMRIDGMLGFLENDDDISGMRFEVRRKF